MQFYLLAFYQFSLLLLYWCQVHIRLDVAFGILESTTWLGSLCIFSNYPPLSQSSFHNLDFNFVAVWLSKSNCSMVVLFIWIASFLISKNSGSSHPLQKNAKWIFIFISEKQFRKTAPLSHDTIPLILLRPQNRVSPTPCVQ